MTDIPPFVPRPKLRKRKRKAEGVDDILGLIQASYERPEVKDPGLRCKECRKLRRWKDLYSTYEIRHNDVYRLWWCPNCQNLLREDNLTDLALAYEVEAREEREALKRMAKYSPPAGGPQGFRLLICGDRNWTDVKTVAKIMRGFDPHTTVLICGMARGADRISYDIARRMGMNVMEFPADWDTFGKAAGPRRNVQMLREGKPELVIAFHDDLDNSKGTRHMVETARKAGVKVRKVRHKNAS